MWIEENNQEWRNFRDGVQEKWLKARPEFNDATGSKRGKIFRKQKEKKEVRIARTLFVFSLLVPLAGIVDIAHAKHRKRGLALVIVGSLFALALCDIWAQKKNGFIEEVIKANRTLTAPEPVPKALSQDGWTGPRIRNG